MNLPKRFTGFSLKLPIIGLVVSLVVLLFVPVTFSFSSGLQAHTALAAGFSCPTDGSAPGCNIAYTNCTQTSNIGFGNLGVGTLSADPSGGFLCTYQNNSTILFDPTTGKPSQFTDKSGKIEKYDGSCGVWWTFEDCIWNQALTALGTVFLSIGAGILQFAGLLFDTMINVVVIGFGSTLQSLKLTDTTGGITVAWDAFRDLANILIIGMFTFIAISTILGSKEYGYKRLVAKVLVIAVLMNFSLLFTEMIIDASNFTAYQLYSKIAGQSSATSNSGTSFDVALAFMQPMGITSALNTSGPLSIANRSSGGYGIQAMFMGLVGAILMVVVAAVLFYGTILMGARAIVLIVLMLTSVVAFATYLLPNFAGSKYGWKGWWETLINCAVFAPVLMLFLSVSLLIVNSVAPNAAGGPHIGDIITDPSKLTSSGGWQVVFTYLIAVGLLFVSLKISSQFANSTSGIQMSIAGMAAPLALTTQFGSAAARRLLGRPAVGLQEKHQKLADAKRSEASQLPAGEKYDQVIWEMKKHQMAADAAGAVSRSTLNPANTRPIKALSALIGLKPEFAGQTTNPRETVAKNIRAAQAANRRAAPPPLADKKEAKPEAADAAAKKNPRDTAEAETPHTEAKPGTEDAAKHADADKDTVRAAAGPAPEQPKKPEEKEEAKDKGADSAAAVSKTAAEGPAVEAAKASETAAKSAQASAEAVQKIASNLNPTKSSGSSGSSGGGDNNSDGKVASTPERGPKPANEANIEITRKIEQEQNHSNSELKGLEREEQKARIDRAGEIITDQALTRNAANEITVRLQSNQDYDALIGGKGNVASVSSANNGTPTDYIRTNAPTPAVTTAADSSIRRANPPQNGEQVSGRFGQTYSISPKEPLVPTPSYGNATPPPPQTPTPTPDNSAKTNVVQLPKPNEGPSDASRAA